MSLDRARPNPSHLDLVRMILDHQLLDSDYVECGKVDDLEVESHEGTWRVTALLTGRTRVPWGQLERIGSRIKLHASAEKLGLDGGERIARRWLSKWPGAR